MGADIVLFSRWYYRMRIYREQETWGNAYRKPAAYTDLVSFKVKK